LDTGRGAALRRLERAGRRRLPRHASPRPERAAGSADTGRDQGGTRAPARVSDEAPARLRGGALGAIEEVVESVLATTGKWTPEELRLHNRGKRQGFFCDDADVNSFLDEALTWRDVGFQWHWSRRRDAASLETALPAWALQTLGAHAADPRPFLYSADQLDDPASRFTMLTDPNPLQARALRLLGL
jgi:hypothetical protein